MSKVNKRISANIKGVLELENGVLQVRVEDIEKPFVLTEFAKEFIDLEVCISIIHKEDLD